MDHKKDDIFKEIDDLANYYEANIHGCAQATILALKEFFEIDDIILKTANSLSGGIAEGGKGNCGAFIAGALIFSYYFGRDIYSINQSGSDFKDKKLTRELRGKFYEKYNGEICHDIQKNIFGKSFDMLTQKGKKEMEKAGAHDDKCTVVVGNAAKWIAEILLAEGVPIK